MFLYSNHTVQVHQWLYELCESHHTRLQSFKTIFWNENQWDFVILNEQTNLFFFSFFFKYLSGNTKIMDFLRVQGGMEVFQLSYQVFVERSYGLTMYIFVWNCMPFEMTIPLYSWQSRNTIWRMNMYSLQTSSALK